MIIHMDSGGGRLDFCSKQKRHNGRRWPIVYLRHHRVPYGIQSKVNLLNVPIGSMYGRLMLTWLGYIDGKWQTIYGIQTDPMGLVDYFDSFDSLTMTRQSKQSQSHDHVGQRWFNSQSDSAPPIEVSHENIHIGRLRDGGWCGDAGRLIKKGVWCLY